MLQLAGLVDHGHLSAVELGHLQGERADAPARPVQQHLLAGPDPAHVDEALHRQHACLRDGGSLLEGHSGRFAREARLRRAGVLGERAEPAAAQIAVDLVTRLERRDISAHGFDAPGDVTAEDVHLGLEEPAEKAVLRRPSQHPPVPIVDGCGEHPDQDLIGVGRGLRHVSQLQDVGRPVPVHDRCLHACIPMLPDLELRPDSAAPADAPCFPSLPSGRHLDGAVQAGSPRLRLGCEPSHVAASLDVGLHRPVLRKREEPCSEG